MNRKLVKISAIIIIVGLAGIIIPISLIINNSRILSRIYYEINYNGSVQNLEPLIEKSELFEYEKYCKYRNSWGEGPLNTSGYYYKNIDREFIESLKMEIDREKKKFHFFLSDHFYF